MRTLKNLDNFKNSYGVQTLSTKNEQSKERKFKHAASTNESFASKV
jgi:hypothetical protein